MVFHVSYLENHLQTFLFPVVVVVLIVFLVFSVHFCVMDLSFSVNVQLLAYVVRERTRNVPLSISRRRSGDCGISFTKRWPTATCYIFSIFQSIFAMSIMLCIFCTFYV